MTPELLAEYVFKVGVSIIGVVFIFIFGLAFLGFFDRD